MDAQLRVYRIRDEYRGEGEWDEAERAHYASPERQSVDPDPARRIVDGIELPVRPQPLP